MIPGGSPPPRSPITDSPSVVPNHPPPHSLERAADGTRSNVADPAMNLYDRQPRISHGLLLELWKALRHPREMFSLAVLLEGAALTIVAVGVLYALVSRSLFITSGVLVASLVAPALAIVVASRGLRSQGFGSERIFIGLCAAVSGIWLFEILYHYSYAGSFAALPANLKTLNIDTGLGNFFPLPWSLIMVALPAVAYRRMSINPVFLLLLAAAVVSFWFWITAGYPQFDYTTGSLALDATVYNTVTKLVVCLLPASLFLPSVMFEPSRRKGAISPGVEPEPSR
jgi:hypothetical protein